MYVCPHCRKIINEATKEIHLVACRDQHGATRPAQPAILRLGDATITRIDLYETQDGLRVDKYPDGWLVGDKPIERTLPRDWTLKSAVAWLESQHWTIRTWPGGARAFCGQAKSVRTAGQIIRLRQRAQDRGEIEAAYNYAIDW